MPATTSNVCIAKENQMTPPKLRLVNREAPALRAAIYARFSDERNQKVSSIVDQNTVCDAYARRTNRKVVVRFDDKGKRGGTMFDRPGLRDLMDAATRREFDIVIVEHTDRLSRNRADLPAIVEHLNFHNVKLHTQHGEVSDEQLAFDGLSNRSYSKRLAERVKRSHDGLAFKGLIHGSLAYGYCTVKHKPGERVINADEAKIVVRIFVEYVSGKSPREIAEGLTRDGIPSPSGAERWNFQCIVGGEHKRGIIRNELYVGIYVKNRFFNIPNPATGKVITRPAEADDLITKPVPHLRIIAQELWDAAHALRKARSSAKFGAAGYVRASVPRKQHLLSGLIRCGVCSGPFSITASSRKGQRVSCSAAYNTGSCKHGKTYDLGKLTAFAVDRMDEHLTDPEFLKERAAERVRNFARLEKENSSARQEAEKKRDRLTIKIAKLVRMTADDDQDEVPAEVSEQLKAWHIERKGLLTRIELIKAESNNTALLPSAIKVFAKGVETLAKKLKRHPDDPECHMAFANIVGGVVVHPTANGERYDISLYARLSAIMGGIDLFPAPSTTKEIVAAQGLPSVSVPADMGKRSH
jgi:site-specific DNA recombinase